MATLLLIKLESGKQIIVKPNEIVDRYPSIVSGDEFIQLSNGRFVRAVSITELIR